VPLIAERLLRMKGSKMQIVVVEAGVAGLESVLALA
jgi:hypothetical protein